MRTILIQAGFRTAAGSWLHMGTVVEGFAFNDFCERCQKVTEHQIELEAKEFSGMCSSCNQKRPIMDPNQVYYPKTDLWVTRFKIGNLSNVVAGKLLDAARHGTGSPEK